MAVKQKISLIFNMNKINLLILILNKGLDDFRSIR